MLSFLKRGSASATTSLVSASLCSRCARAARPRELRQCLPHNRISLTPRFLHNNAIYLQQAAAAAAYPDEAAEESGGEAISPSSDSQGKPKIQHGPVTKFAELAERGLVCQTVVDTLTRDMGLETMTQVQSLTINESLKGADM